ncbi:MAG: efflux transporter outer membrane subunit [Proteobacteria bacterium]|nr:efflux transporter outer membrane subunit [Pseudomonadota bacterium]
MRRNVLSIILIIICLAGCSTMAPDYKRPASPVPAEWPKGPAYKEAIAAKTGPLAVDVGWREFYVDEKLQNVIELALNNNRDLRVATLNIEKARALYRIQRAELYPAINASGVWTEQRVPADISTESGEAMSFKQYSVNLGVSSWELDFFGRIRSLKDRALEQYLATEQAGRSAQISLVAEVANVYLTLAADRENLKFAQSTLEAQQATYKLLLRRYEVGTSSELDLRQAQTRLDAARVDIARYTRQVALDGNALDLLVGSPVPSELLSGELDAVKPPKDITPGLPSEVLLRRPDILQAEHGLKAAYANIGAARAALFPRIALTTNIGTTSNGLSGLFRAGAGTWTFVPQITMPIFDARLWSALDAIKVEREIVLTQYEKVIQTAFREVADALAQRGTVEDQLTAQESLFRASSDAYRLSNARYTKGIDSYLPVLDAQRSLYSAQQGLIAIRLSRLANLVTLYKVLGGGTGEALPVKRQ